MKPERVPRPIPWFFDSHSGMIFMEDAEAWLNAKRETPIFEAAATAHNERLCTIDGWMPF